ncbi:sensor histidine kinase [Sediminibacillus massiliensis]|uniref:sensor histidine kinase n=1 Tax=Sediminibacillus massiliensis TaxID=1926277 RepID=UPI0009885D19|nr:sensor histidine kinase [Sediminibacillus massiliensis]
MRHWYQIIPKNIWLSTYIWVIFCMLPFYFLLRTSSTLEIIAGIGMILLFFTAYRLSFLSQGWPVYLWVSIEITISIIMTLFFGYVYLALFLAFFIGNVQHKGGFLTLYVIHLVSTIAAITIAFFYMSDMFLAQLPFIIISVVGVILLPFNMYNRIKREKLEGELENANKRISQLMIMEERQRIARDLHDTLGQKLSLIGLKSDLAGKLIYKSPAAAMEEVKDINDTARTALKEVREMVANMRGNKLRDEVIHVKQILDAAQINYVIEGSPDLKNTPLLVENVLSMCLKEAITNVVKHSQAVHCKVIIGQSSEELLLKIKDDGIGIPEQIEIGKGNGLRGMRERLEFVNGSFHIETGEWTVLDIRVPHVIKQPKEEGLV